MNYLPGILPYLSLCCLQNKIKMCIHIPTCAFRLFFTFLVEISLSSCLTHCPSQEAEGLARLVNVGRRILCVYSALPFFLLVMRKEAWSASPPAGLQQESARLGIVTGSMCLRQRWSIHSPASLSSLSPADQYKHYQELLWCSCLPQPESQVCLPVRGELFTESPKVPSLPETSPAFYCQGSVKKQ